MSDPTTPSPPTDDSPTGPGPDPASPAGADPAGIVAGLTLEERVRLLSGADFWHLERLEQHGLGSIMVTDGPHGLRKQGAAADHLGVHGAAPATCFPTAATLGASWDEALLTEVGEALGREASALGVSVVLGPGLNLKRHPAGGRNFEYYSEDPLLSGRLAAAFVRGAQSQGVGTSIKHFAVNNQETFRLVVDAVVDERTLRELYLTGFEIAVKESSPWTVMCAYNLVNGLYCSEHHRLLTGILRDEWGFGGLVMSDWGATNDRALGVAAGLDLEMPGSKGAFDGEVLAAVRSGTLAADEVDLAARRVVELIQRGQGDGAPAPCDADEQHALARRAAAGGTVLLTNDGTLPLAATGRLAVIGAFAESPRYQGAGSSQVTPTRVDAALDALRARVGAAGDGGGEVAWARGYDAASGDTTDDLVREAVAAAAGADVAIVFAGLPGRYESEGFDRDNLDLPAGHTRLIEAVAAANPRAVVVLSNGAPVHLPWVDRVAALVEAYLGGQAGGSAIVDVLFGDAEPGGRLAESFPVHVAQLPADRNFPGRPRQVEYREGLFVGYRFHDTAGVPARFAFGHGLSYTTFELGEVSVVGEGQDFQVRAMVTNNGDRAGSDVVQVYVRDVHSSVYRPHKELRGFAKVHLAPGESQQVTVALGRRAFAVWDVATADWAVEAGEFEVLVGASSVDIRATHTITVASDDVVAPAPSPSGFEATDAEFTAMLGHPIPVPPPTRPFTRNSTLADMQSTLVGRGLLALVTRVARQQAAKEFPDADEATVRMIESAVSEGPARALVAMSGGLVPMGALDGRLDVLNRRWGRVARRLRPSGGRASAPRS